MQDPFGLGDSLFPFVGADGSKLSEQLAGPRLLVVGSLFPAGCRGVLLPGALGVGGRHSFVTPRADAAGQLSHGREGPLEIELTKVLVA